MWMVRAGEGAVLIDRFKAENRIVIGWEIGDLSNLHDATEVKKLLKDKLPERKAGQINIAASQISKFRFEFKIGDNIISYDPQNRVYSVGEIISDYFYDDKFFPENPLEYCDSRKVKWLGEVKRDELSTSTKNTLGAISTIFEINPGATHEIFNALKGKKIPEEAVETEDDELVILKDEIASK
jgi:restriction system protein